MTIAPVFNFPIGSEVTLFSNRFSFSGREEAGYQFTEMETGVTNVVPFQAFVDYLKLPGVKVHSLTPQLGSRTEDRLGGFRSAKVLPD